MTWKAAGAKLPGSRRSRISCPRWNALPRTPHFVYNAVREAVSPFSRPPGRAGGVVDPRRRSWRQPLGHPLAPDPEKSTGFFGSDHAQGDDSAGHQPSFRLLGHCAGLPVYSGELPEVCPGPSAPVCSGRPRTPNAGVPHREITWPSLLLLPAPSREKFYHTLEEGHSPRATCTRSVIKGTVVAIEKDMAIIDVGLKMEGRVAVREFTAPGRQSDLKVGGEVEVYLEPGREHARRSGAVRDKARPRRHRASSRRRSRTARGPERHLQPGPGGFTVDLDSAVACRWPGRHPADRDRHDERLRSRSRSSRWMPARQHRGVRHRAGDTSADSARSWCRPRRSPGHRRRSQEHHRLWRLRGSGRHRRPAARHRHRVAARQYLIVECLQHRPAGQGQDHQDQPRDPHASCARHEAAPGRSVAEHPDPFPGQHPLQGPRHQHHRL